MKTLQITDELYENLVHLASQKQMTFDDIQEFAPRYIWLFGQAEGHERLKLWKFWY